METLAQKKMRAAKIISELERMYPEVRCELNHEDAYQLLVATILSAQCTDKRVNMLTPALFDRYPTVIDMAQADRDDLIIYIRSTGFFNNKSTNILACCKDIVERFKGEVPGTLEELTSLAGVGRKTANVILNHIFHVPAIVVDTHVGRSSRHLGLTREKDPTKVEFALMKILPKETWIQWNHQLIKHGRTVCIARRPQCELCQLKALCPGSYNN
ncbi:MAG: endonuclease III [Candidatus Neomarinimicrobiota bacterium]|nr:MAG: endonuclease III [Candidatus Neomarinimicrobiota bacterium]